MKDQVLELCSDEYTDDQLFIDEKFDSCIIGVCFDPQGGFTTAYSLDKILNFLVKNEKMTENESKEHLDNIKEQFANWMEVVEYFEKAQYTRVWHEQIGDLMQNFTIVKKTK